MGINQKQHTFGLLAVMVVAITGLIQILIDSQVWFVLSASWGSQLFYVLFGITGTYYKHNPGSQRFVLQLQTAHPPLP